jgi:hypothetical protein
LDLPLILLGRVPPISDTGLADCYTFAGVAHNPGY